MSNRIAALPGQWYQDRDSGGIFQIVSVDPDGQSVNIQYVDGSLEETGFDDWLVRNLQRCEQPEDWVGSYDDLESDDIGLPETPSTTACGGNTHGARTTANRGAALAGCQRHGGMIRGVGMSRHRRGQKDGGAPRRRAASWHSLHGDLLRLLFR